MSSDKEESVSNLIASIVRKSKLVRAGSLREISNRIPEIASEGAYFLDDEEAIAVKRVATSKYLDFPHVLRAGSVNGVIVIGSSLDNSAIGEFLTTKPEEDVFVFLEPWLLRGATVMPKATLAKHFWEILKVCDHTLKAYDSGLSKSCILSADEDEKELGFAIAK